MAARVKLVLSAVLLIRGAIPALAAETNSTQAAKNEEDSSQDNQKETDKRDISDAFDEQPTEPPTTVAKESNVKPESKAAEKHNPPPAQPVAKNYEATAAKLAMLDALDTNKPAKAEKIYQEALKKFPNDPDLRAIQEGRSMKLHAEKARAILDRSLADSSQLFGRQWLPGDHMADPERSIRIQNAKGSRSTALDYDPAAMRALASGYRYLDQGDPARAQKVLTAALNKHDVAPLRYARSMAYAMRGDLPNADKDSIMAVSMSHENPATLSQRTSLMMAMGRRQEAYAMANATLASNSQDADALAIRGRITWKDKNKPEQALEDLKKAAEINPKEYGQLYQIGQTRFMGDRAMSAANKGNYKQASQDAQAVLKTNPADSRAHTVMGIVDLKSGNVEGCIKETTMALKSNPQDVWAYFHRAIAMETLGQRNRAIDDFKRAAMIAPNRFGPFYKKLVQAQRDGKPPLWQRESTVLAAAR
jgi:tetratricopeptide (TPR) repeat protein